MSSAPVAESAAKGFREQYAEKLQRLAALHHAKCPLPDVELRYQDLSYTLHLKKQQVDRRIRTFGTSLLELAKTPLTIARKIQDAATGAKSSTTPFHVLDKCSGVLRPGSVTLLVSPPGHGKTSFLRALANRLPSSKMSGSVTYSGLTAAEAARRGIEVKQLVSYCDQLDVHLPLLTVRETFQFVHDNNTADPALYGDSELEAAAHERVSDTVKLLSLSGCQNTIVGDDMLRGVSGGEKKRVTIGETLVTNARALLLDEPSTGLDSAVTYDITASLRAWAKTTNGTVVIAMLQPTPEVYSLFDDVILLREGAVVYHGPRESVGPYLGGLGYRPPQEAGAIQRQPSNISSGPSGRGEAGVAGGAAPAAAEGAAGEMDFADWLVELLTHPSHTYKKGLDSDKADTPTATVSAPGAVAGAVPAPSAVAITVASPTRAGDYLATPPVTTELLVEAWRASPLCAAQLRSAAEAGTPAPRIELSHPFTQAQYGRAYPRSFGAVLSSLLTRQWRLTARNKLFVTFRICAAIVLALILGSVFWDLGTGLSDVFSKYGLFLFGAMQVAFANFGEVPIAVQYKYAVYKNISAGQYPGLAYVLAVAALHIPIAIAESLVFSAILYFMSGLAPEAGRFFFFTFALFMTDIGMAAFFRIFAYGFPDMETAQVAPGPVISIQMLFAGFLITRDKMGWLLFMNYLSVFGWALRSLAQNEFFAPAYDAVIALAPPPSTATARSGEVYLTYLDMQTDPIWKWMGILFMAGFFVAMNLLSGVVLNYVRIERNIGSSRTKEAAATADDATPGAAVGKLALPSTKPLLAGSGSAENLAGAAGAATPGTAHLQPLSIVARASVAPAQADVPLSPMTPDPHKLAKELSAFPDEEAAAGGASPSSPREASTATASSGPVADAVAVAVPAVAAPTTSTALAAPAAALPATAASAMPFTPLTLVFNGIRYTVPIAARTEVDPVTKAKRRVPATTKVLLQGVSGYAKPGTITALMGASGAGKTTLLDVIAGRKNSGKMEGTILLNGFPKEQRSFARMTGYVEQMDIHNAYSTVREALEFSARLRLPATVSTAQRAAWVSEVLEILELDDIADRKIGESGAADGLSPGQRKRLTIGVELVANPPALLLDEPTSGLDSRAAAVVARVMRRIADRGRTVVTTIHQPAADIFLSFDQLLLLQRGGWQVYMGPIGRNGRSLVRYMESIPGTPRCPRNMNPASYMLDVLGGTDSSGIHTAAEDVKPAGAHHAPESVRAERRASGVIVAEAAVLGAVTDVADVITRSVSAAGKALAEAVSPGSTGAAGAAGDAPRHGAGRSSVSVNAAAKPLVTGVGTVIPPGAIENGRAGPSDTSPGVVDYQAILFASQTWTKAAAEISAASTPAPGSAAPHFDSPYARNFLFQLMTLIKRGQTSYYRNTEYNFTRVFTLIGLHILFGVIYYHVSPTDVSGIQSIVSVMFMTSAFIGLLNMNTCLPVLIKERPVFYRERFSLMYNPTAYALSCIVSELPYMALIVMTSVPIVYFMVGLNPDAGVFFFYCLVCFVFVVTFISLAQFLAAVMPSIQVAQAMVGLVIPILFLLGGLFLREPQIPRGWKWAHIIDPITYALDALVAPQFYCSPEGGNTCPTVLSIPGNPASAVDRYAYVADSFGLSYGNRWKDVGYLCAFVGVFQVLHFLSVNFVSHIKR